MPDDKAYPGASLLSVQPLRAENGPSLRVGRNVHRCVDLWVIFAAARCECYYILLFVDFAVAGADFQAVGRVSEFGNCALCHLWLRTSRDSHVFSGRGETVDAACEAREH